MSNFEWSKDEINQSEISSALKQELIDEIRNVDETALRFYKNKYTKSFKAFKNQYKKDAKEYVVIFSGIKDTSMELVREFEEKPLATTKYTVNNEDPEKLIRETIGFYTFLNDYDLTSEYMHYLTEERHHIKISSIEGKNIAKIIKGRTLKADNGDVYISLYKENALNDFTCFIHETGHMLSFKLFYDNMNPLIKKHLNELEAFLLEFIACKYVGLTYKDEEIKNNLILEALRAAYEYAKRSIIQDIAAKYFFTPKGKRIRSELLKLGIDEPLLPLKEYLKTNYGIAKDGYNSVMAAYDLYCRYENDLEKCLYEYKRLLTSDITDINSLYDEFGITYPYDGCKNATEAIRKLRI